MIRTFLDKVRCITKKLKLNVMSSFPLYQRGMSTFRHLALIKEIFDSAKEIGGRKAKINVLEGDLWVKATSKYLWRSQILLKKSYLKRRQLP